MVTEGVVPYGFVACPECQTPRKPKALIQCAQCPAEDKRCAECAKKHRKEKHRIIAPECQCCSGELRITEYAERIEKEFVLAAWRCSECSCVYTFAPGWKRSVACDDG